MVPRRLTKVSRTEDAKANGSVSGCSESTAEASAATLAEMPTATLRTLSLMMPAAAARLAFTPRFSLATV